MDAMVTARMPEGKVHARYLVTRDTCGFMASPVEPISPDELLALFQEQQGISYECLSDF